MLRKWDTRSPGEIEQRARGEYKLFRLLETRGTKPEKIERGFTVVTRKEYAAYKSLVAQAAIVHSDFATRAYDAMDNGDVYEAFSILAEGFDRLHVLVSDIDAVIDPPPAA